ncbi:SF1B family DNA helicase RecD2 [Oenococcus oeni]|uniref:SF1B family DNA helicase RecD2 n=1 Tax=Oenococcus oeni TaxID=1247 RepID=UPI0008F85DD0|nr:ATP-dependent RecD-like DNA helicase [Oenococcus oeni]OIM26477.1 AAA family ATPase [Oenococcus oeni]SYW15232.1 ATP-dependent RecD-like DNA helicase [Oenococcus oeni]
MAQLVASIKKSFFKNSANNYAVFLAKVSNDDFDWEETEITLTGEIADLKIGESYEFSGKLTIHPKYGKQFNVFDYQSVLPDDNDGLIDFLSSDLFEGVGRKTAEKIVDNFGGESLDTIVDKPDQLKTLGLKKKQIANMRAVLLSNQEKTKAIARSSQYGLSQSLIERLFDQFGSDFTNLLSENPYQLIGQVDGFTFQDAQQIARFNNLNHQEDQIDGAVIFSLLTAAQESGDTYLSKDQLVKNVSELLESGPGFFDQEILTEIESLQRKGQLFISDSRVSLAEYYRLEESVIDDLKRVSKNKQRSFTGKLQLSNKSLLDDKQKKAVESVFKNQITILTGGPGTGKTTVIKTVIQQWERAAEKSNSENKFKQTKKLVLLAAPTGRAAARITEVTGRQAVTIHHLLGATSDGYFDFDENNQLQAGLIVIDEMSMVDLQLFQHFLRAVPNGCRLLLVGDKDQLPSVGAGQILTDLILSDQFKTIELQINHRQTKGSGIDLLSQDLKRGIVDQKMFENGNDISFFSLEEYQLEQGISRILSAAMRFGIKKEDLQIITPTNRLVELLNQLARPYLIDRDIRIDDLSTAFLAGDRVMQQENNPEKGVNNGDIGYVIATQLSGPLRSRFISVDFLGNTVMYKENEINQLRLSYASTVHKSQGSEFRNVIFVLTSTFNNFVTRNLVYTGVTRAEKSLILIGSQRAFTDAINNPTPLRQTNLVKLLNGVDRPVALATKKEANESPGYVLSKELIENNQIDPMIGMNGIKPGDFIK